MSWAVVVVGELQHAVAFGVCPRRGLRIEAEAAAVNGWDGSKPTDVSELEALRRLSLVCGEVAKTAEKLGQKPLLIGHNVDFDARFVAAMAKRQHMHNSLTQLDRRRVDTCQLAAGPWLRGEVDSRSLDALCDVLLGGRRPGAHACRSTADVLDTLDVLRALVG